MRIIRYVDNPLKRIAFGDLEAAESFIAHTSDPALWIIEPASSTVANPETE